jgi:hypothetical protein
MNLAVAAREEPAMLVVVQLPTNQKLPWRVDCGDSQLDWEGIQSQQDKIHEFDLHSLWDM